MQGHSTRLGFIVKTGPKVEPKIGETGKSCRKPRRPNTDAFRRTNTRDRYPRRPIGLAQTIGQSPATS